MPGREIECWQLLREGHFDSSVIENYFWETTLAVAAVNSNLIAFFIIHIHMKFG
jgi:predicted DNA-binding ribbon-helix-helix protein